MCNLLEYTLNNSHTYNMKIKHEGMGERLIKHKAKSSAILGLRPCPSAFIFILYKHSSPLTGLKCGLVILFRAFIL